MSTLGIRRMWIDLAEERLHHDYLSVVNTLISSGISEADAREAARLALFRLHLKLRNEDSRRPETQPTKW